ncbi:MAG: hypothetical protein ACOYIR_08060 [Christensenellales bacterium]|jgi:hypothetical protein
MVKKLKRRGVAAIIAAVVMVLTFFASGGAKLSALRSEADRIFYSGERGDGLSIYGDLNTRLDCAYNMGIIARRSGGEGSGELGAVQSAYDALAQALNSNAPKGSLAALNRELSNAVETLYRAMEGYALSDTDETLVARQYRNFLSANDTISHGGYNLHAAEFNQTLSAFPANVIALFAGVSPLDYFR